VVKTAKKLLTSNVSAIGAEPYVRPSGEKMLGAYSCPRKIDFGVIVEKNESDAYLAVTQMAQSLIVWIIIGFFVAAVGAIVVSVSLTSPLRRLTRAARMISGGDLTVRIEDTKKRDEIGELSSAFKKMLDDLRQYIDQLTVTTKAKERAESELKLARNIQESFLPKVFPQWKKIEIWGKCIPAREVGGDYFDFFQIDDDNYGMVIGDVSGKGVPAALFMAVSRTLFRILSSRERCPDRVLTEFNDKLVALDQGSNMFITLFYGVFNDKTHRLLYSSAGHNMPYVKGPRGSNGKFQILPSMKTMVAGIMDGLVMAQHETHLRRSGDTIVLYTDGMTEADNPDGEEFGEERLEGLLNKYCDLSAQELCEVMMEEVKGFQADRPQFDDMTMLVLKVR
jgi:sigma-B regulation protein RsbU (phosphoserine phosphatase)